MTSMKRHVEVRRGAYYDSVTLLGVSRDVERVDGVERALVAMATPLNVGLLRDLGFAEHTPDDVSPNDLLIAIGGDAQALDSALAEVDRALSSSSQGVTDSGEQPPRTMASATRSVDTTLALVSVPGEYAFVEAMDALRAGLHVMVFSDNVAVDQEIALKAEARRRRLLVMGPDCGTAIVGGVGLGFANVVRPGPVGVVAASGTGAQQVCCLLDAADVGISHVLGVGGRDLSAEVGGAATVQALALLDDDPATELIVVVSKPPDPAARDAVMARVEQCATPVVVGFVGRDGSDLTAVSREAVDRLGVQWRPPQSWKAAQECVAGAFSTLRGLFSGGTLCDEAMVIAADALGPIRSNIPLERDWQLGPETDADGHVMIDFGDDDLTRGRPHPMIDHSLRVGRLEREAQRPGSHVVLLDVVLGHGADDDPAGALAPAIASARERAAGRGDELAVVVSLCGTRDDPQGLEDQARRLVDAGAAVHLSNADAAREAVRLVSGS